MTVPVFLVFVELVVVVVVVGPLHVVLLLLLIIITVLLGFISARFLIVISNRLLLVHSHVSIGEHAVKVALALFELVIRLERAFEVFAIVLKHAAIRRLIASRLIAVIPLAVLRIAVR